MKYVHITLYVSNLQRSLAFYRDLLGMNILQRIHSGGREIVFLGEAGQPSIELIAAGNEAPKKSGFSLGFRVESLEEATRMMENAGYPLLRGPISPNPNLRFSFFHDPDAIEIQVLEYKNPSI